MNDKRSPASKLRFKSPNTQKNRVTMELNQIRSILTDFRKTKFKCLELAKNLREPMPNQEKLKNIQISTLRKMDLVDITGLVNIKNQLVRALTELFELQSSLRYKKQKYNARRSMMDDFQEQKMNIMKQVNSAIQSPRLQRPVFENQPKKVEQLQQASKTKNKNLQIPIYRPKNQSNENKLDRISKYMALIKRNMKQNSESIGYKWRIKEFLMEDPNYLKLRQEIEKYQMRQQELDRQFSLAVQKGVRNYVQNSQILESNSQFKLIKVYKKQFTKENNNMKSQQNTNSPLKNKNFKSSTPNRDLLKILKSPSNGLYDQISNYQSPSLKKIGSPKTSKIEIQNKAAQDFDEIKKQLQKSNQSYIEMLSKINQTVQKGSQKLIEMRQKRKKKFQKDDDIWDQLDKI